MYTRPELKDFGPLKIYIIISIINERQIPILGICIRTLITCYSEIEASIDFHMERSHGRASQVPSSGEESPTWWFSTLLKRVAGGLPGKADQPYIT